MYLLGLGLVLLIMKYLEISPVDAWSWWLVLLPFGLTVLWWAWSDATGYTKRQAMDRENARKQARVEKNHEALGTAPKKKRP